jgi:hypothetical protein
VARRQARGSGGLSCDWRKGTTCRDGLDRLVGSNALIGSMTVIDGLPNELWGGGGRNSGRNGSRD